MASSLEHGKDLPSVQLLMKKNQVRQRARVKIRFSRFFTLRPLFFPFLCGDGRWRMSAVGLRQDLTMYLWVALNSQIHFCLLELMVMYTAMPHSLVFSMMGCLWHCWLHFHGDPFIHQALIQYVQSRSVHSRLGWGTERQWQKPAYNVADMDLKQVYEKSGTLSSLKAMFKTSMRQDGTERKHTCQRPQLV